MSKNTLEKEADKSEGLVEDAQDENLNSTGSRGKKIYRLSRRYVFNTGLDVWKKVFNSAIIAPIEHALVMLSSFAKNRSSIKLKDNPDQANQVDCSHIKALLQVSFFKSAFSFIAFWLIFYFLQNSLDKPFSLFHQGAQIAALIVMLVIFTVHIYTAVKIISTPIDSLVREANHDDSK